MPWDQIQVCVGDTRSASSAERRSADERDREQRLIERRERESSWGGETKSLRGEGNGLWVWKAEEDRCVQMEKMTDPGGQSSESFGGGWAGLTFRAAGLVEDIFLKNHLLLHGGKCVVIIL